MRTAVSNEYCWLGIAPAAYSGASYRSAITAYVRLVGEPPQRCGRKPDGVVAQPPRQRPQQRLVLEQPFGWSWDTFDCGGFPALISDHYRLTAAVGGKAVSYTGHF